MTSLTFSTAFITCLAVFLLAATPALRAEEETASIWNLDELRNPPVFRWDDDSSPIRSLIYEGATTDGEATEVFAFYATPETLGLEDAGQTPYPGVVLIHGGGGTAFADWVDLWARRGYAAIAMDLSGRRPPAPSFDAETGALKPHTAHDRKSRTRLERAGLDHTHAEKFASVGGSIDDDWPLHAVTNVILAHSLIRNFDEVDAERTAVTGISWGGYTTCLAASVDTRFKAAVPVYGCGFLHEGESVQKKSIDALEGELRHLWIDRYDPGSHLPSCRVPILFVNGTNDIHYPLDSYAKSYAAVPGPKNLRIEVKMRHGHQPGWAPEEIGRFVDAHCGTGAPLPSIKQVSSDLKRGLRVSYVSELPITQAHLHFTTDTGLQSKREWQSRDLHVDTKHWTLGSAAVPAEATTWFVNITDEDGAMVSSPPQFR